MTSTASPTSPVTRSMQRSPGLEGSGMVRWLIEHGFGPLEEMPEMAVLRSQT